MLHCEERRERPYFISRCSINNAATQVIAELGAFAARHGWNFSPASALTAKAVALKGAMAGAWPPVMIGLGLVLTLAWSGSLLWLFVRMILALV